ncbi:HAD-superfamily hydrolase [Natrialba hulunbeirensis JCM 10989]|uniref:HAD-superfamily hydrolase n=1 Tax=Natrialba hulunbeirensis JCM 10989 TaxID=1227493 RepID=L9ZLU9_9EURY|nr:HAD family hydrolase [Natrialba hulunbeirensis]ELY86522.1 HAD-superfamily hydrolase [Natrialba hulunbeirensis JCM 10989]
MAFIEAVCFDLDGTLCFRDDELFHEAVFDRVDIDPFFGPQAVNAVDPADLPPAESITEFWEYIYRAAATTAGGDPAHAPQLAEATVSVLETEPPVRFRTGAQEALRVARERGPIGLITQGSVEMQTAKLEVLGLTDTFDATVFCGSATTIPGKPSPEPFERALEVLGTRPAETVYVGNDLQKDVGGACAASWQSVWVPEPGVETPAEPQPEPTAQLASMADLPAVLA